MKILNLRNQNPNCFSHVIDFSKIISQHCEIMLTISTLLFLFSRQERNKENLNLKRCTIPCLDDATMTVVLLCIYSLCIYRPLTKLREGYVFTGVCDSVHRGGCAWLHGGWHPWLLGGVWLGVCVWLCGGHASLLGGAWLRGWHVWLLGGCMVGGHAWLLGGMHGYWGGMHRI